MDAFPNQPFTEKVVSIDTTGSVSSGVTTYPAYIVLDAAPNDVYPNMAVDATIILAVKDNVILIPSAAVQTTNSQTTVRVMKNGAVSSVSVTIGATDNTNTEIVSGISEGDTVVTSVTTPATTSQSTTSPFSAFGGGNRTGGTVRIGGR